MCWRLLTRRPCKQNTRAEPGRRGCVFLRRLTLTRSSWVCCCLFILFSLPRGAAGAVCLQLTTIAAGAPRDRCRRARRRCLPAQTDAHRSAARRDAPLTRTDPTARACVPSPNQPPHLRSDAPAAPRVPVPVPPAWSGTQPPSRAEARPQLPMRPPAAPSSTSLYGAHLS